MWNIIIQALDKGTFELDHLLKGKQGQDTGVACGSEAGDS